jgi:hypothetical protein
VKAVGALLKLPTEEFNRRYLESKKLGWVTEIMYPSAPKAVA